MGTTIKVAPLQPNPLWLIPGAGKTYNTIEKALRIIGEKEEQDLKWDDREAVTKQSGSVSKKAGSFSRPSIKA